MADVDWDALRGAAREAMTQAYAPYSRFPVGVAGLVDDGRVVTGCNVENASYGLGLCAECGMVSDLARTGGGRLVAVACVGGDGQRLTPEQIRWVIGAYTDGSIPDEQMSALLMAVFFRGMDGDELAVWTQAMIDSGVRKDLSSLGRPTADKHSTGGGGGKNTLPFAPPLAGCGGAPPQLSRRGTGQTG